MDWNKRHLFTAVLLGLVLRCAVVIAIGSLQRDYYWEYGELSKNLISGKGYSLFYFQNDSLQFHSLSEKDPFPSAYMPPGYTAFLTPFMFISDVTVRNILLISVQTVLSLLLIILIFLFTREHFTESSAVIAAYAVAVFPDFIYSVLSFTPTILYQCGVIALMILLYRNETLSNKTTAWIIVVSVCLLYLRFEFFLYSVIIFCSWLLNKMKKRAFVYCAVLILALSPWVVRNYLVFDEFIPFTTSVGLNLYRGNNAGEFGDWGDNATNREARLIAHDKKFEIGYNNVFWQNARSYILDHPIQTVVNTIQKTINLWIFNIHDKRTSTMFFGIYSITLFLFFVTGSIVTFNWEKHRYAYLFFISTTLISSLFFVLPRYQTTLRALIIPFAAFTGERCVTFLRRISQP